MSLNFLIIGGDKRQLYAGRELEKRGHGVSYYASEVKDSFSYDVFYDYIILPAPISRDGSNIFTPLDERTVPIEEVLRFKISKGIFGGKCSAVKVPCSMENDIILYDILENEEYNILNAVATAEAAISIAIRNTSFNIKGSDVLVAGFGKIGKVLANALKGLGANVFVAARKATDRAYAENMNCIASEIDNMEETASKCKIIFNTVPKLLFDEKAMKAFNKCRLVIDLASAPGGVDFSACEKYGIKAMHALGLPGEYSPEASGEITAKIILNMIDGKN